jgi:hypothetical protein
VEELPPPTPPLIPDEPEPIRTLPIIDPNPLLQMAADDESLFDPVYPLPPKPQPEPAVKPKREKKKKLKVRLPDYWPLAELPAPQPRQIPTIEIKLPDQWPLAEQPQRPAPPPPLAIQPETFEVLAYRSSPATWPVAEPQPAQTLILSPPEPAPPAPKYAAPRERRRFTWESPEMYLEDAG